MSHDKIVQAIKIKLNNICTEHTELGIYSASFTKEATTLAFAGIYTDSSPIFTITTGDINSIPVGAKIYGTMFGGYVSVISKLSNTITLASNASGSGAGGISLLATVTGSPCVCAIADTTGIGIGILVQCPTGWGDATDRAVIDVGSTWIKLRTNATATSTTETVTYQSNPEIRLCENPLIGTNFQWATGILAKSGISTVKQNFDGSRSGAPVQYDGINVYILNTNQYILRLHDLGIELNGSTVELWEFRGTEADNDSTSADIIFTGSIQDPEWSETILSLPCPNNKYKNRAECGVVVNNDSVNGNFKKALDDQNGEIVPLTFGKFYVNDSTDPATQVKSYAKFNRISAKQTIFTNDFAGNTSYLTPKGTNTFPVVAFGDTNSPHLAYKLKFGTGITSGGSPLDDIINAFNPSEKYIKVTVGGASVADGSDSFTGTYRKISKYAQISGTTTSGSPIITAISDTSSIVVGSRVTLSAGFASYSSTLFNWTVLSKTASTITIDVTANANGAVTIRQGYVVDYSGLGIIICLDSFFEKNLCVSSDATAPNNAWCQLVDVPFEFQADNFPCLGFLDEAGNRVVASDYPRLFVYDQDTDMVEVPSYGYTIPIITNNNKFTIDLKLFKNDPSSLVTYSIFPCRNFINYVVSNLGVLGNSAAINKTEGGLGNVYSSHGITGNIIYDVSPGNQMFDRDDSTYGTNVTHVNATNGGDYDFYMAYSFDLPIDKINMNFDKFYIGINFHTNGEAQYSGALENKIIIFWKRFLGSAVVINSNFGYDPSLVFNKGFANVTVDNLPDFYYLNRTQKDNNKAFYYKIKTTDSYLNPISGLNLFSIDGIVSADDLKSIYKMYFLQGKLGEDTESVWAESTTQFKELALICEKSFSISKDIYAVFGGRIYNDTIFATRYGKTATDLIENPVAILEHVKRLQNGSEYGDTVDFGKEYSPSIKIKTGATDGSYDNLPAALYTYRPAFQIFDRDKASTDKIAELICKRYGLCTYQDKDGFECVEDVFTKKNVIGETSTLATIALSAIVGDIGATKEPKAQDVFVNPLVNYSYNPGSKKYDKNLQILNSSNSTYTKTDGTVHAAGSGWEAELTPGFQGTDGQAVWEACNVLWDRFRQIELAPSDLSDCEMITTYIDALAYITKWVNRMGLRRISFNIPYIYVASDSSWARDWHVAQHININFPHQTNGGNVECTIESIVKDKNKNLISLEVILLDDISTGFFLV